MSQFRPSLSHRIYTLIGAAWPSFGIIFLFFLCWGGWLKGSFSLSPYFPAAVLLALISGFLFVKIGASSFGSRLFVFLKQGQPIIFFDQFAQFEDKAIDEENGFSGNSLQENKLKETGSPSLLRSGLLQVSLSVVSELKLTFFGTLELRSSVVTGDQSKPGYVLARFPLSCLGLSRQKAFIEVFRQNCSQLVTNKRLEDRLASPLVKGQNIVQSIGAVVLILALLDVSYASFSWLDILKEQYIAQTLASAYRPCVGVDLQAEAKAFHDEMVASWLNNNETPSEGARRHFQQARTLKEHPFPFSWAYSALFKSKNSASQMSLIEAQTLYLLGDRAEAVELMQKACGEKISGIKPQMALCRAFIELERYEEADKLMAEVEEEHKDLLLPHILRLAIARRQALKQGLKPEAITAKMSEVYKDTLPKLDENVFGEEPAWPPGGERPIIEMWRRDDLTLLAQTLLGLKE